MTTIDINTLFSVDTAVTFFRKALDLAAAVGLPVTSWRTGDPTLVVIQFLAEQLAARDEASALFVKSAFLKTAEGDWKTIVASEVFGVDRDLAEPSTPTLTLTNAGGGRWPIEPGDITVKSSVSGVTFHNTAILSGTSPLVGGASIVLQLVCDVDGSDGTVASNEIDTLVTTMTGVICAGSSAATGLDEQDDASLEQECLDSLGALSPNGPADAYEYVARNFDLTGVPGITRARATHDDDEGQVTVYVADADGAISDGLDEIGAALDTWATPLCITATAASATNKVIDIEATVYGDAIPEGFEAAIEAALRLFLSASPIANEDGGEVAHSLLETKIHNTVLQLKKVVLTVPAGDVSYVEGEVPVIGSVVITEG